MNYQIYKKDNKYQFLITEDKKVVFASSIHYFLIPNIRSEYEYAWKACYDARHIIHNQNHHLNSLKRYAMEDMGERVILDISAEQMLINHYLEVFENLKLKAKGCISTEDKERVKKEIDIVKEQMNKVIEKIDKKEDKKKLEAVLFHIKKIEREYKIASVNSVNKVQEIGDEACKKELMEEYGYKICEAIQQTHRDCHYNVCDDFVDIYDLEDKEQILKIEINDRLHICSILPLNKLAEIYPYHSWEFYQKYWKLIIENVGHFYINDLEALIAPVQFRLPDIPTEDKVFIIKGFDVKNCEEISVGLKFKKIQDGKDTVWMFNSGKNIKIASSKYNEQDYSNAIVKCIDPALKSIYGRTGCVIEVVPLTDYVLLDVDFGRGLDVIRIKEEQIEIVKV